MELSNALKSLLATLTTKTAVTDPDGVLLASTSDGTPNGKINITNLAESLGVQYAARILQNKDCNTCFSTSTSPRRPSFVYMTGTGVANAPLDTSANQYLMVMTMYFGASDIFQLCNDIVSGKLYFRFKSSSSWSPWRQIWEDSMLARPADLEPIIQRTYRGQWYGDCTTAADTAAKTCTITGFLAVPTSVVTVHFASAINVAASEVNGTTATLNISSTGAKPIMYKGVPVQPGVVRAGNLVTMQYDGTNYNIIGIEGLEASAVPSNLYVDMGLPSGTLWATRNVDITQANGFAASEYQYECSFFSWGNTEGHNPSSTSAFAYDWGSANDGPYASTPGSKIMGQLSPSQDFARANCGAPWRLPTTADFAELFANIEYIDAQGSVIASSTTDKRTTMNSITGLRIRSTVNGNIIFFPCSGLGNGTSWSYRGAFGDYWSSSLNSATNGRGLNFNSGGVYTQGYSNRFYGFAARPVQ